MKKGIYRLRDVEHVVEIVVGVVVHALADREDEALDAPHVRDEHLRKARFLKDLQGEVAEIIARKASGVHRDAPEHRLPLLECSRDQLRPLGEDRTVARGASARRAYAASVRWNLRCGRTRKQLAVLAVNNAGCHEVQVEDAGCSLEVDVA